MGPHVPPIGLSNWGWSMLLTLVRPLAMSCQSSAQDFALSVFQCPGSQEPFKSSTDLPIRFSAMERNWMQTILWVSVSVALPIRPFQCSPPWPYSTPWSPGMCLHLFACRTDICRVSSYTSSLPWLSWSLLLLAQIWIGLRKLLFICIYTYVCMYAHIHTNTHIYVNHLSFCLQTTTEV